MKTIAIKPTHLLSLLALTFVLAGATPCGAQPADPLNHETHAMAQPADPLGGAGYADGTGSAAPFSLPSGMAVDSAGNVYVGDSQNHAIRKITPAGVVITLAGLAYQGHAPSTYEPYTFTTLAGYAGYGSADGTGSDARFAGASGVAVDSAGNVYVADTYNQTIRKITPAGVVTTLAGLAGSEGTADGTGNAARFKYPNGVAVDGAGNVYVTEGWPGHTIRKITPAGVVTTLAGLAGTGGSADGTGSAARFYAPSGVAVDSDGNVYVADGGNSTIRKVTPTGVVTTLAGKAEPGAPGRNVDGTGAAAHFSHPDGVAVDSAGNVYVADTGNQTIRKVTLAGVVTTLAGDASRNGFGEPTGVGYADGTGRAARFNYPADVAVDSAGNVYVADTFNHTIRKVTPAGVVATLAGLAAQFDNDGNVLSGGAGSADGTGNAARFDRPQGVAVDSAGNVYVVEAGHIFAPGNSTVRKVTPAGVVTTLAGLAGRTGSVDGTGITARFDNPSGVAVDSAGNVYVVDYDNSTIRKVTPTGVVTTLAGLAGRTGSVDGTGITARFDNPSGVAVDSAGNVYVADTYNNTIRKGSPALRILKSGFDGSKFVLNLTGQIGRSATLETSTDLVNWLPLATASFFISQLTMTDPDASAFPRRFYRVFYRTNSPGA